MNQITFPLSEPEPVNGIDRLTDELLSSFKRHQKKLPSQSWDVLTEILDFVAEAEQTIADQKQHIARLEVMTSTDPLTGLLNRRGLMPELRHAIAAADRHDITGAFIYIDLDNFKQINDDHGHAAGDHMLTFVSETLASSIRQTDYAARLGGDEFALLLTHTEPAGARRRSCIIQHKLNNMTFRYQDRDIPVQASFGISEIMPGAQLKDILHRADQDMYANKTARRDVLSPEMN